MLLFALYDKKGMFYMPPFTVENKIQAIRGVEEAVNDSGTVIGRYPDDFALYFLGEFDNKTGKFVQPEMLTLECECRQLVRPIPEQANFVRPVMDSDTASAVRAADISERSN